MNYTLAVFALVFVCIFPASHASDDVTRIECDLGKANACNSLAMQVERGIKGSPDKAKAVNLYRRACALGSYWACNNLAWMYANSDDSKESLEKAQMLYKQSCDTGDAEACLSLGLLLRRSGGIDWYPNVATLFDKACKARLFQSCDELALLHYGQSNRRIVSIKEVLQLFARACDGNYFLGCHHLAWFYYVQITKAHVSYEPNLPQQNLMKAVSLYEKACYGGIPVSCDNAAQIYADRKGAFREPHKIMSFRLKACEMGYAEACMQIGWDYLLGKDVVINEAVAQTYFQKGCALPGKRINSDMCSAR